MSGDIYVNFDQQDAELIAALGAFTVAAVRTVNLSSCRSNIISDDIKVEPDR